MRQSDDFHQLALGNTSYPRAVSELYGELASPTLWYAGNLDLLLRPAVGFCGSRKVSEAGLQVVVDCAEQLAANNVCVTSGYAKGVDTAAHSSALRAGGFTTIVLPEGTNQFRIKRELREIWDWSRVLVVSQFEPNAIWRADRAMERNKLIVALSGATVVIEAGESGGTLNAGYTALRMSKPLFVAQYSTPAESAVGNEKLLAAGACSLQKSRRTGKAHLGRVMAALDVA